MLGTPTPPRFHAAPPALVDHATTLRGQDTALSTGQECPDPHARRLSSAEPNLPGIRERAHRVLGDEAERPTSVEVLELQLLLRGDVAMLIPMVEDVFGESHTKASQVVAAARRLLGRPGPEPGKERLQLVRLATCVQLLLELLASRPRLGTGMGEGAS